jgi:putative PEP-CTERM system histidine kinase
LISNFLPEKIMDILLYLTAFTFLLCIFITLGIVMKSNWDKRDYVLLGAFLCLCIVEFSDYIILSQERASSFSTIHNAFILSILALLSFLLLKGRKSSGKELFISKEVACHLGTGIILIFMSLLFVLAVYLGISLYPDMKGIILMIFLVLGIPALYGTFCSEKVKREIRVFIDKNFYRSKYDYRRQWLHFTESLFTKTSLDELFNVIVKRFSKIIRAKNASLWLYSPAYDAYTQSTVDNCTTTDLKINARNSLIIFFNEQKWIYDSRNPVEHIENENRKFFDSFCPSLIVPLQSRTDTIGFVALGDSLISDSYNYEDYDILKTLAKQATATIMNTRLAKELAEARQMVLMGKIASFVVHDLKNLSSALSLMAEQVEFEVEGDLMSRMLMQGIEDINTLIEKIKNFDPATTLKRAPISLNQIINEVIGAIVLQDDIKITSESIDETVDVDKEELKKVLSNLILNASDSIEGEGEIHIEAYEKNGRIYIDVSDTGCGIPEVFIDNQLFRPFQTTKSKGMGIGLYQSKVIVEAHGGKLIVKRNGEQGTVFSIELKQ